MSKTSSPAGYFRWPAIHGERVVFVSEDDLWEVPLTGGIARRLTSGLGSASNPVYSPDGSSIAYSGSEEGAREVFVMDASGGPARQLTFLGAHSVVVGWSSDGKRVRFRSAYRQFSRRKSTIFEVDLQGGEPTDLGLGPAHWIDEQPDGAGRVLGRHADDLARWKRYRGGTAGKIWLDAGDGWHRLLPHLESGLVQPMWLGDGRIYFINDEDGTANIWSCTPSGDDLQKHTSHHGFYARFAQTDGTTIVYAHGGDIWRFAPGGTAEQIDIQTYSPRVQMNRKFVSAAHYLGSWGPHPTGHTLAITARGKLFTMGNWEGGVRQIGDEHGTRYRMPILFDDGKQLLVSSDASGEEVWEAWSLQDKPTAKPLTQTNLGRVTDAKLSPDEKRLAVTNHRHELYLIDVESGEAKLADHSPGLWFAGLDWSADSRWLAYSVQDTWNTSLIRILDATDPQLVTRDVTEPGFRDHSPCFDPKGRYLYFISSRWFDPVYDSMFFEISFPKSAKPCVITLAADEPSLFFERARPLGESGDDEEEAADEENEKSDDDAGDGDGGGDDKDKQKDKDKKEEPDPVEIDFDGIGGRIESFDVPVGRYGDIRATEDRVFWLVWEDAEDDDDDDDDWADDDGPGVIEFFELEKRKRDTFCRGANYFELSADRKTLVYETSSALRVVAASSDGPSAKSSTVTNRKSGWIDLSRIPVSVSQRAEWRQMLREAWRLMRDQYWSEDLCGADWDAIWERYAPLVDRVASRSEFSELVWTMQGELGTSHAYEIGGDYRHPPYYLPGMLAANFTWDDEVGAYRIDHIARGATWDRNEASPLAAPGVNAAVGEHVVAINGRRVDASTSVSEALVRLAGREVDLTLRAADGEERTKTVRTLRNDTAARYRDWVDTNRRYVHEASDGRLGYVHIPDMSAQGFAEFHRGFLGELRREGLVVDVRNNGGGHVSQLILEKLARRQIGYDIGRWTQPLSYPQEAIPGPLVAITDENAGSDGDIFSHCFKLMGLGPLVGTRTWGGVVGIWPRHRLVDNSVTTQPEFAFWFEDVGFAVENYGTDPDIEVEVPPQCEGVAADPQLNKGIELAMAQLAENPPTLPDFGRSPNIRPLPEPSS